MKLITSTRTCWTWNKHKRCSKPSSSSLVEELAEALQSVRKRRQAERQKTRWTPQPTPLLQMATKQYKTPMTTLWSRVQRRRIWSLAWKYSAKPTTSARMKQLKSSTAKLARLWRQWRRRATTRSSHPLLIQRTSTKVYQHHWVSRMTHTPTLSKSFAKSKTSWTSSVKQGIS